jgi:hypothetical protein
MNAGLMNQEQRLFILKRKVSAARYCPVVDSIR